MNKNFNSFCNSPIDIVLLLPVLLKKRKYLTFTAEIRTIMSEGMHKKTWLKPTIHSLNIKKDTFGATSGTGAEQAGKAGPPKKKGWG